MAFKNKMRLTLIGILAMWLMALGPATSTGVARATAIDGVTHTQLPNGQVLVLGSEAGKPVAYVQDPGTNKTTAVSITPRVAASATVLTDGRVLIVGGRTLQGAIDTSAVLWDYRTGVATPVAADPRADMAGQTAMLLADGRVYLAGGTDAAGNAVGGVLFDPVQGRFVAVDAVTPLDPAATADAASLAGSSPALAALDAPIDGVIALRFTKPLDAASLNAQTVTLIGPSGETPARIVVAEGGMLAFLTPEGQLFPGSSYSVFVNGAHDRSNAALPFTTLTFNTLSLPANTSDKANSSASTPPSSNASASHTGKPAASNSNASTTLTPTQTRPKVGVPPVLPLPSIPTATQNNAKNSATTTPAMQVLDDEDWTPDARNRGGKWRTARHATLAQEDSVKQMRKAYTGGTAVSGQVLRMNGKPLMNVALSVDNVKTRTDAQGRFILNGLTPGRHELIIDGRQAGTGTVRPYGYYVSSVDLKPEILNELRYTIWMPKIRAKDITKIASPTTQETVITHPDIPGLELHIPAGVVIRDRDGKIVTQVAITPVPVDQAPFPVPENFPVYFVISPGGAVVQGLDPKTSQGIRVIYPNYLNSAPGTEARFWNFDPSDQGWFIYGNGKVSADGLQVVPDPGVAQYDWMVFGYGTFDPNKDGPEPVPPPCEDGSCTCDTATDADPVDCFTGLFVHARTDVVLKDVMPVAIHRVYRPGDTVVRPFGYGTTHQYAMYLQSPLVNGVRSVDTIDLILANGARITYRLVSGTAAVPGYWEHTESATRFYKSRLYQSAAIHGWEIKLQDGSLLQFSPHGLYLTGMLDRYGNSIELTESAGNITRITTQNGRYADLFYDTSSRIQEIRDFEGRSVLYEYDPVSGMLTKVTYPDATYEQYGYDTAGRMTTVRDRRGNTMATNEYYPDNRIKKQTLADGAIYQFAYVVDATGRVVQTDVTDPRGYIRRVRFDHPSGYPTSETHALGTPYENTTTTERDPVSGRAVLVTDALGRKTRYTYDPAGNVASITYLDGTSKAITESYTWTPDFQQLATYTDPLNHTTTLNYDALGNLTSIVDPLQQVTQVSMDGQGRLRLVYDPNSFRLLLLNYDQAELRSVYNNGRTTTWQTDPAGRVIAVTNPANELTRYQYDLNNYLKTVTDPKGGITQLTYDPLGDLQQVIDPKSTYTTFVYNARNQLWAKIFNGYFEIFNYDGRNNLKTFQDRSGRTTTYDYDPLNRLAQITYPDNTIKKLTFDAGYRLRSLTDNPADPTATISRDYDDLDRLTAETTAAGSLSYTYDNASRRATLTVPGQSQITYGYDNADRLTSLTQGASITGFGYDSANRRTRLDLPNGIHLTYKYNAADLTGINYTLGATPLGNFTYGYDADGRLTALGGSFADTMLPATATATYNGDHSVNAYGSETFTYDYEGNIKTRTSACGLTTYTWNVKNQLTQIVGFTPACAPLTASFTYDALGRRHTKTINGVTTSFVYDGLNPVQEKQGSTTQNLLTGLGIDEFLARSDGTTTRYYLPNQLGSTIALTDPAGSITNRYYYSPYGATVAAGEASSNSYQYTGRENDGTGLYYYRARYYDPAVQRFISSDPIGLDGGLNTYAYVENNPLNFIDPYGLCGTNPPYDPNSDGIESLHPECILPAFRYICDVSEAADSIRDASHRKRRGSKQKTNDKHTKPRAGGPEKADDVRDYPRQRPADKPKGPWPPKR